MSLNDDDNNQNENFLDAHQDEGFLGSEVNSYAFMVVHYKKGGSQYTSSVLDDNKLKTLIGSDIDYVKLRSVNHVIERNRTDEYDNRHRLFMVFGSQDFVFNKIESLFKEHDGMYTIAFLSRTPSKSEPFMKFERFRDSILERIADSKPRLKI